MAFKLISHDPLLSYQHFGAELPDQLLIPPPNLADSDGKKVTQ